jgi:hypothetical protein
VILKKWSKSHPLEVLDGSNESNVNTFTAAINLEIGLIADNCGLMSVLLDQPNTRVVPLDQAIARILKLLKSDCCCVVDLKP